MKKKVQALEGRSILATRTADFWMLGRRGGVPFEATPRMDRYDRLDLFVKSMLDVT